MRGYKGRRILATGLLATSLLLATQSLADVITYNNSRFGTEIRFPAGMFTETAPLPANGDGILFTHPDGGSLAVFAYNNALDATPKSIARSIRETIREDFSITYERVAKDWMVQSGFEEGVIYYQRLEFGADNIIHGFLMKYPESLREKYDKQIGPIGKSLTAR